MSCVYVCVCVWFVYGAVGVAALGCGGGGASERCEARYGVGRHAARASAAGGRLPAVHDRSLELTLMVRYDQYSGACVRVTIFSLASGVLSYLQLFRLRSLPSLLLVS